MLIVQRLQDPREQQRTTFEVLNRVLAEQELECSSRTLQRDLQSLREDFGLVVRFNNDYKAYSIDELSSKQDVADVFRFLELNHTTDFLKSLLSDSSTDCSHTDYRELVSFDRKGQVHQTKDKQELGKSGVEHITPILQAIKQNQQITIKYQKFQDIEPKKYLLQPYLIKEFERRWYLVAVPMDSGRITKAKADDLRIYALDRVRKISQNKVKFSPSKSIIKNLETRYNHLIGFYGSEQAPEKVVLSFTPKQGHYVKTQPWHHSQKTIVDNNTELRVSLRVVPNFELERKILHDGASVKVLEPGYLRDKIKSELEQALAGY